MSDKSHKCERKNYNTRIKLYDFGVRINKTLTALIVKKRSLYLTLKLQSSVYQKDTIKSEKNDKNQDIFITHVKKGIAFILRNTYENILNRADWGWQIAQ